MPAIRPRKTAAVPQLIDRGLLISVGAGLVTEERKTDGLLDPVNLEEKFSVQWGKHIMAHATKRIPYLGNDVTFYLLLSP